MTTDYKGKKQTRNSIGKWRKDINRQLTDRKVQMATKYMKIFSKSQILRNMSTKDNGISL